MTSLGTVAWVETRPARAYLVEDRGVGDDELVVDSTGSLGDEGVVVVGDEPYDYVTTGESTLTITPGLSAALEEGAAVSLLGGDTKWAGVVSETLQSDALVCRVPFGIRPYSELADGIRSGVGETVVIDRVGTEYVVTDLPDGAPTLTPGALPADVAPGSSPAPSVWGVPGPTPMIAAQVPDGVENESTVEYEFHLSTSSAMVITPGGPTLAAPATVTSGVLLSQMPDGSALLYDTETAPQAYYVAVWAKSGDEYAPAPSAWVEVRIPQNGTADLRLGSVTAGLLAAIITMSSLFRTAETGQRAEFDNAGIRVYDSTGAMVVNLSPTGVAILAQQAYVKNLETGGATFGGLTIGPAGGEFRLTTGIIAAPPSPLQHENAPVSRRALVGGAPGAVFTDDAATYWWRAETVKTGTGSRWQLHRTTLNGETTTTYRIRNASQPWTLQSAAMSNGALYLIQHVDGANHEVQRFARPNATTFNAYDSVPLPAAPGTGGYATGEPVIGVQRTTGDVLIAHRVQGAQTIGGVSYADQQIMVRRYTPSATNVALALTLTQTIRAQHNGVGTLRSVGMDATNGMFDLAAVASNTGLHLTAKGGLGAFLLSHMVLAVPNSGASVTTSNPSGIFGWYGPTAANMLGMLWDGAAFWATEQTGDVVLEYGTSADASADRWHAYTLWNGTQESKLSEPIKSRTFARYPCRWTINNLPQGVTQVRLYMAAGSGSTPPARTAFERVATVTGTSGQALAITQNPITPPTTATNPPPATSNFPGGAVYKVTTNDPDTGIYGDGRMTSRDPLLPNEVVNKRTLEAARSRRKRAMYVTANLSGSGGTSQIPAHATNTTKITTWTNESANNDTGQLFTLSSGTLTCVLAGQYQVTMVGTLQGGTGGSSWWELVLMVNGSEFKRTRIDAASNYQTAILDEDLVLGVGDTVEYHVRNNTGSPRTFYGGVSGDRGTWKVRYDGAAI